MEAVLHIEPIMRHTHTPLHIGHTDYIFYGNRLTEDGEDVGNPISNVSLGCPLESFDHGSHHASVPLVKTIEYVPDLSRDKGHVYSETLHYFKDRKFLIPYRSKIRTGLGQGLRLTHLPSLNAIRGHLTGNPHTVIDPRSAIVSDVLLKDQIFDKRQNTALREWISDDLTTILAMIPVNHLSFDTADITSMVNRYIDQVHSTSNEITEQSLKNILSVIAPPPFLIPTKFTSDEAVCNHLLDFKRQMVSSEVDFRSPGRINVERFARIDHNPSYLKHICEIIDTIPLTDFNVDIVITPGLDVNFYHEHISQDRFGIFEDNDAGLYSSENVLRYYIDESVLGDILEKIVHYHTDLTAEIEDIICHTSIKLKLLKTISDEAAILLYRYDSLPNDPPLCGVYFDIALQSLAPMSITREPVQI